jgi:hypothetical protein
LTKRGRTGPDRPTPLPSGFYEGRNESPGESDLVVSFVGEDDRSRDFDFSTLPFPGWNHDLAKAWAHRTGPAGELRTLSTAKGSWTGLKHFFNYLERSIDPPASPGRLRERHIKGYRDSMGSLKAASVTKYLHSLAALFDKAPLSQEIHEEVKALLRPRVRRTLAPVSGYSDRELATIEGAARRDVQALCDRLAVTRFDHVDPALIERTQATGVVPSKGVPLPSLGAHHRSVAEPIFVTRRDLLPILILFVILTGWNVETIKELSAEHQVLEDKAVQVRLTKRRQGPNHTAKDRIWEIGRPGRELHHSGGFYLLLHRLMVSARELLDDDPYWSVWAGGGRAGKNGVRDAFGLDLNLEESNSEWVTRHDLRADAVEDSDEGPPLELHFNRLKTSIDVRRVRKTGGHLPSSVRSNTVPVLFRNYLLGDAMTLDWAREQMADGLAEVEEAALEVHRGALASMGRAQLSIRPVSAPTGADAEETAWTTCGDHAHHPLTGRRCTQSFLDCFHCANSIITSEHLPNIMGLLDALERRRAFVSGETWWKRYGPTWTAIRYDVLPKFTEHEVENAIASTTADAFLDLVEPRWEQP